MGEARQGGAGQARILVVEDDAAINDVVCSFLSRAGYACVPAFSGTEALLRLEAGATAFDLVITDLMLPGAAGERVVETARRRSAAPIIVTSARREVGDRVDLLRLGADDYLVKPFDLDELLARVEAHLRRWHAAGADAAASGEAGLLAYRTWRLDASDRSFHVAGAPVKLTRTEYEMMRALMDHPGRVLTKRALSAAAGGDEAALEDKSVATHVGNLRAKLKPTGTDAWLETVWGIGFKLA